LLGPRDLQVLPYRQEDLRISEDQTVYDNHLVPRTKSVFQRTTCVVTVMLAPENPLALRLLCTNRLSMGILLIPKNHNIIDLANLRLKTID